MLSIVDNGESRYKMIAIGYEKQTEHFNSFWVCYLRQFLIIEFKSQMPHRSFYVTID